MAQKLNTEEIKEFWRNQALMYKQSSSASWSDKMVILMEIDEIVKRLNVGDRILDIGCANGYSTVCFASQKQVTIKGIDYIPEMIKQARLRLKDYKETLEGSVKFDVGDITSLNEPSDTYDKVIVIRVLINLAKYDCQLKGLYECSRVLKPGGMLLLSEATLGGWNQLNNLRAEWGLPDIPMPKFNLYIDEKKIVKAALPSMQLMEVVNFSSTYYVGTRFLKPLFIKALGAKVDVADPDMEWNKFFAQLPAWGDYGTQKLFIFRKK